MACQAERRYTVDSVRRLVETVLVSRGLSAEGARLGADVLIETDVNGVASHGVASLFSLPGYVRGLEAGFVNPHARLRTLHRTSTTEVVDAEGGFGPSMACLAADLAVAKAREFGIGMVAVTNSHHFGAAGYYAQRIARNDMIGLVMTNSRPAMTPTFARQPGVGTNPIAVAAPAGEEPMFLLDIATSVVAGQRGHRFPGDEAPGVWFADALGIPTRSPREWESGGGILPLGSWPETSSHKGYGLAVMVDIFSGLLSGQGYSLRLSHGQRECGHFLQAFRIDLFQPAPAFKAMMDAMLRDLKALPPVKGSERVLVPGQKEAEARIDRLAHGIPHDQEVWAPLEAAARELGVELVAGG